jgi:hypothetical protein
MARIRSVKPEFWADEDLADVSRDARLLYIGLWNLSDEHGRLRGDPRYVKGQLFPYDDDLSAAAVSELLKTLEVARKVVRYRVGAGQYVFLPNLGKHQRLESEKVPSRLPPPPDPSESAQVSAPDPVDPDSGADKSAPRTDESAPDADESSLLYVAGSMEHVAGSMEHGGAAAPRADKPRRTQGAIALASGRDDNPQTVDVGDAPLTENQRSKRITDAYHAVEPMSKWVAINGIVTTAVKAGKWTDDEIRAAMLRLAADGRTVTTETLRIELAGKPAYRSRDSNGWDGPYLNPDNPKQAYSGYRQDILEDGTDAVA